MSNYQPRPPISIQQSEQRFACSSAFELLFAKFEHILNMKCFYRSTTNCITQILTDVQKVIGTLDVSKFTSLLGFDDSTTSALGEASSAYCTECAQKFTSTISSANLPEHAQVSFGPLFESQCSASGSW